MKLDGKFTKTLIRQAWNEPETFLILIDHLLSTNQIEVPKNDDSLNAPNFQNWMLESQTRNWILDNLKIKTDLIYHPIWLPGRGGKIFDWLDNPKSVTDDELQEEEKYCSTYIFTIQKRCHREILTNPVGTGPVSKVLGNEAFHLKFKEFLEPYFEKIIYGKTTLEKFLDNIKSQ